MKSPGLRLMIALVLTLAVLATAAVVWASGSKSEAPDWLILQIGEIAKANGDAGPDSARWVLTDAASAAELTGGVPDQDVKEYVVILTGTFTAYGASSPNGSEDLPTGSTVIVSIDATDHIVNDFAISPGDVDPGKLDFQSLPLGG